MKRIFLLLFISLSIPVVAPVNIAAQWQQQPIPGTYSNLHSLHFISDRTGFAIACDPFQSSWSSNYLLKTVDGGTSWQYGTGSELCSPSVFFVNNEVGYFSTIGSFL